MYANQHLFSRWLVLLFYSETTVPFPILTTSVFCVFFVVNDVKPECIEDYVGLV